MTEAPLATSRRFFNARKIILVSLLGLAFLGAFLSISGDSALDVEFPIAELGDCADKDACRAYCDDLTRKEACLDFAESHGLIEEEEARRFKNLPPAGPGGCRAESECRVYCGDILHAEECLEFARDHGLIAEQEIKKAEEIVKGTGPGGCRGAAECRAYCDDSAHNEECLLFANRKGLISGKDLETARTVLKDGGPGGCRSEDECRAYCEDTAHLEECADSAVKLGFITSEEANRVKKLAAAAAGGPGGCEGREACRAYCDDSDHQAECIDFAEKNGFMTRDDAERARKLAGKTGPGGCKGEQCRDFCENPDNAEACLEYAEREGLLPKEELERAKKFVRAAKEGGPGGCRGAECRNFCNDPANMDQCFEFAKKEGLLNPGDEKRFESGKKIRQKMDESGGPGGCENEGECRAYCADPARVEECIAFAASHGGMPPEEARAMLKEFAEGRLEARGDFSPPEDFERFETETRQKFEEFKQLEDHFRGRPMPGFPGGPGGPEFGSGGLRPRSGELPSHPQGFPGGSAGFVGPGGCSSPAECIKYCSEHKEECFSFGPPGEPQTRPPEGGLPPGQGFPRIKTDIVHEFKPGDLPPDLNRKSEEERREFFRQKFQEFRSKMPPGSSGKPGEFPGRPEDFPAGQRLEEFRPPEGAFRGFPAGEGFKPPEEGVRPPDGELKPREMELRPPEGSFGQPPPGDFRPPEEFRSGEGSFQPPPEKTFTPPPSDSSLPPPSGLAPTFGTTAAVLGVFFFLFP